MEHPPIVTFVYTAGGGHGRDAGTRVEGPAHVAHRRIERGWARLATEEDRDAYLDWLEAEGLDVPEAAVAEAEPEAEPEPEPESEAEEEAEEEEAGGDRELPEDFPARDKLVEAGLSTVPEVAAAADSLEDVRGVGPATKQDVLEALTGLGAAE